ncbi:hypothetical protein ACWD6V_38765, partial [Streptomyces sp. NPDC005125]
SPTNPTPAHSTSSGCPDQQHPLITRTLNQPWVPAQGSWMKMAEAIDFVKAVKPQRAFAIHDAQINDRGLSSVNGWLAEETDSGYQYLMPGESV